MLSFEQALGGNTLVGDVDTEPTGPITVQEAPMSAAARMLELAAITADQLVTDAKAEVASLVTLAQTRADVLGETSRNEAHRVAAELARTKDEQAAALDSERATALAGLADEKAALEAQIATLRQMEIDHRGRMRHHLTEQLSLLETNLPEPPAVVAG